MTADPTAAGPRILFFADSLAFHGPKGPVPPTDPQLYTNVCAAAVGDGAQVDLVSRLGFTARDGWWALTKDPTVWGEYLPRADIVVLSLGHMDQLPAAVPTWVREAIPFVRPGSLRRAVRRGYLQVAPPLISLTDGRISQLSPRAANHYLGRILTGIRYMRPDLPVVRLLPTPYDSDLYPSQRPHAPAVVAAREWCAQYQVPGIELDELVLPGPNNPDGLHWGWPTHQRVGEVLAAAVTAELAAPAEVNR